MPRYRTVVRFLLIVGWLTTLAAVVVVQGLGDRSALGTLAMFAPRHLTPLPWLPVIALALFASWQLALLGVAGLLVTLFGVSGFVLPRPAGDAEPALRVVTYNTDGRRDIGPRLAADVPAWNADVIAMIDCTRPAAEAVANIPGYTLTIAPFACILTRHRVVRHVFMPPAVGQRLQQVGASRGGRVHRVDLDVRGEEVSVYVVHLETPRSALWAARNFDLSKLAFNADLRSADSNLASTVVDRRSPNLLVLGDFNLTVESAIYRRDWGDLTNAFSSTGGGFGHTMFAGRHRIRIDHVLAGPAWRPIRTQVMSGYSSEHQPVVVELVRNGGRTDGR
jgi:endonuclease/exonuclease/phosphatase (EEP) superfamily protein YafD